MPEDGSVEKLQEKIRSLETALEETRIKLKDSGVELEANEALLRLAMDDMRRIYEDLLRSQNQLMQSDKLATIGLLTAGIVHEINNPLSAARLAFSLIEGHGRELLGLHEKRVPESRQEMDKKLKELQDYIHQGKKCVESMAKIVTDIRTFSRSDQGDVRREDINKIVDSVISIVWNSIKDKIQIVKQYASDIPPILCNPQQLGQVFLNLLVNASQAMGGKGVITIRTAQAGEFVSVRISDTGCGIPEEALERIFEPFFTTKSAEQGTGLGLSITHDIVKNHEGKISVESEVGKGTAFTVLLPLGQENHR